MTDLLGKSVLSTIIQTPTCGALDFVERALLSIDDAGKISALLRPADEGYAEALDQVRQNGILLELPAGQYLIPGFVDLHIHAPQWPQLGKALDVPLEDWLQEYTFPLEARYGDVVFAERIYADLVKTLLANGTTTAVYFGTIHQEANRRLADICHALGQRAVIGKVAMDHPEQCPSYYRDASAQDSISGTSDFIDYVGSLPGNEDGRVLPAVTPRFVPSCSGRALSGLGRLAEDKDCHVQTHCSESDWEHGHVLARFGKTDTQVLSDFGLLSRKTVLAHSNHISDADMDLIRQAGSGVAHCPLSNFFFSDAVFPLRRALEKSVRVGLGTDISGGPSASLLDNCRAAIVAARALDHGVDAGLQPSSRGIAGSRIDFREAFYLATAGGADVLDIPTGRFETGCHFDAILVDPDVETAPIFIDAGLDSPDDIAQKLVMQATRGNFSRVWVNGVVR
ncbi:MAG: guanine deaminase [Stappiaceae bacterium]